MEMAKAFNKLAQAFSEKGVDHALINVSISTVLYNQGWSVAQYAYGLTKWEKHAKCSGCSECQVMNSGEVVH